MPFIHITKLSLSHGSTSIVSNISLSIEQGESFALLGINGAGKSSIVKAILDFIDRDSGKIYIQGIPNKQPRARQLLAFIPEKFTPAYYSTGQQFIDFTLTAHGVKEKQDRVLELCGLLALDVNQLKQPIQSYSKGMCQKLGLIAVFAAEKPLYTLDEPMSGLDPAARAHVRGVFAKLKEEGKTLFFAATC